jgi:hypothetical protein
MTIYRNEIDFKGGRITDDTLFIVDLDGPVDYFDEDMLFVDYTNGYALDVSFHESLNVFSVNVIFENNWENPVYKKNIGRHDKIGLLASIKEAIEIVVRG